jgi:electron transfer flavoprotein-quinone oxidoreductase
MGSGMAAAETAHEAIASDDMSAEGMRTYKDRLDASWVMQDHKKVRRAAHFLLSERVQQIYPQLACDVLEALFTVENPKRKRGLTRIVPPLLKKHGIRIRDVVRDGRDSLSIFG